MTAFQDSFQAEVARLVRKQVKDDQAAHKLLVLYLFYDFYSFFI